jgi:activator of 2-hydroxyglutaryl-CoA dehydratase
MKYFLGLDVGSVNVKTVLIDENSSIVHLDSQRITSGPRDATRALLARLAEKVDLKDVFSAGVSGSGKGVIPKELGWIE